ncbi:hypothetical protein [Bdellovibrio sp. HCB2-146]|uniref:hypothetical protein n=1 Tax=Bdellovibrio sp. HCB2-146 TaxID=3394362 RepID=UPI0039BCD8CA
MMKLNCLIISLVATFVFGTAFARGGDLVNNGGGLAEKNVMYAFEKLDIYIQMCLKSESCKLNDSQKALLETILQNLPAEKAAKQLFFASEKKVPGSFIIDGLVRVAKTGSTVGSPIYINSDLLYTKNEANEYDPMTIPEAVAVLIHELGHHFGNYSHEELDLIGVRASLMLQHKFISTPMMPWNSEVSATVFNPNLVSSFPEVLINVGNDIIDISKEYRDEVQCVGVTIPIPILPVPDLELANKKPVASILHNVHWAKLKEKNGFFTVTITGSVSNNCVYKSNIWIRNNDSKVNITFRIRKSESKQAWVFVPGSLVVEQFKDPWWKIIRLPFNPLQNVW